MSATATACGYWRTCNSAWRLPEQLFEAVVHVQLLDENLHQGRRPPERSGRGNRRTNGPRSNIPAPAFRGCVCRSRATSVHARREGRDQSAPTSESVWAILSRATFDARAWALLGIGDSPAASDCFTASAILRTHIPARICGPFCEHRGRRSARFRVCDTQNVISREGRAQPATLPQRRPFVTLDREQLQFAAVRVHAALHEAFQNRQRQSHDRCNSAGSGSISCRGRVARHLRRGDKVCADPGFDPHATRLFAGGCE